MSLYEQVSEEIILMDVGEQKWIGQDLPLESMVAVEAAHVDYWWKFVGLDGKVIGMTTYGESAPAKDLYQHFGITTEAVVAAVKEVTA